MSQFFRRLHYLLNHRRLDSELASDMQFHREMAGAGRANFGNALLLREDARDAWGWTWIDRLLQDLRYGFRILANSPGFTLTAVLVLALGIGVNVAGFTFFNLVALKPLPVRDSERLVRLVRRSPTSFTSEMAYPSFLFYQQHAKTLSAAMAVLGVPPMEIDNDTEGTSCSFVTPNYFTELVTHPAYGRIIDPTNDSQTGAPPVMLISYGLWGRRFGASPSVIGRVIHLNNKPITIVGVLPETLATLGGQNPDIWLPIAQQPYFFEGSKILNDFDDSSIRMWGKLTRGVSANAAQQELAALTNELRRQHPTAVWDKEYIQVSPGGHLQVMQPEMYQVAAMVGALTLLILAVACGNLGGLLLARAVQREREIGIRLAIGASAPRIFRQLCTESLLLATLGASAGLLLGCTIMHIVLTQVDAPKWLSAAPDIRIVLFTVFMSFFSALVFGLTPALQIARQRQHKTLARQILVTAQVAGTSILLIVAGLLVHASQHALYTDPGFSYEHLVTIDGQLSQHGFTPEAARNYLDRMQARLLTVPGVRSVSLVMLPPLGHAVSRMDRDIDGQKVAIYPNWVTPSFFRTMKVPVLLGRTFLPNEKHAVIVSSSFARKTWPNQNPLGKLVGEDAEKDIVVGVVGDAHVNALNDDDAVEQYWPAANDQMPNMVLIVRMGGAVESLPAVAKSISQSIDPRLFPEIRQIKTLYRDNVLIIEQAAAGVTLIGVVALLLAGVGLIGLVSFTVWQKTKEVAIRVALGATRGNVLKIILWQFTWPVTIGLLLGTALAAAASQLLRRVLFGVSNLDPIGYIAAIALLLLMLAFAALLPAWRALRINVSKALHYE